MSARASSCGRTGAQDLHGSLMHGITEPFLGIPADRSLMPVIINGEGEEHIFEALPLLQWLETHPGYSPVGGHRLVNARDRGLVVVRNRDDPCRLVHAHIAEGLLRRCGYIPADTYYNAAGETYYGVLSRNPPPPPQAQPQPQARAPPVVASLGAPVIIDVPVGLDLGTLAGGTFAAEMYHKHPGRRVVFRVPPPPRPSHWKQTGATVL